MSMLIVNTLLSNNLRHARQTAVFEQFGILDVNFLQVDAILERGRLDHSYRVGDTNARQPGTATECVRTDSLNPSGMTA